MDLVKLGWGETTIDGRFYQTPNKATTDLEHNTLLLNLELANMHQLILLLRRQKH